MPEGARREPRDEKNGRASRDKGMDRTLEDSYPASDPPSTIPDPADTTDQEDEETAA